VRHLKGKWYSQRILLALLIAGLVTGASAEPSPAKQTLFAYEIVDQSIPQPLTQQNSNSTRGLAVVLDRKRGHCLLCHEVRSLDEPSQGNIGPALDDVGARLSESALRLRLVDGTKINADTAMPAYYRTEDLYRVSDNYRNTPVLNAQEIEDVIAWLRTLGSRHDN